MKKQLLLLGTCLLFINAFSQIPNAGFENWISGTNYDEPTGWYTYNRYYDETAVVICEKTTDHTEGKYALKLSSKYSSSQSAVWPGWALSSDDTATVNIKWGFPCTQRPGFFKCDYKYDHRGQDVGMIYIKFTKWDAVNKKQILVAQNFRQLTTSVPSWTLCQLKITYLTADIPDTCAIGLISSDETTAVDSTSLIVDNLRFDLSGINQFQQLNDVQLYPTQSSEKISIVSGSEDLNFATIQIVDIQGRIVKELPLFDLKKGTILDIAINGFQDGVYILKLRSGNKQFVKKFSKIVDR